MPTNDYVTMPQNDAAQIDQIAREYASEPARGIVHGLQKDAIQNSFGARAEAREIQACKTWEMHFELLKINGKDALTFWDSGTTGLTGDIITSEEIVSRFAENNLGPEQRLGRFLARFVSGDNLGAGSFGRGKLVFHAASESTYILVDSLRSDDQEYIAMDRYVQHGTLRQPRIPYRGNEAKTFVSTYSHNTLQPLTLPGTRVTIFDVKPEVASAFKYSFEDSPTKYRESIAYMIEETWWEIIYRFDAKIYLKHSEQIKRIELHDQIADITKANGDTNGSIKTYQKENIPITTGGQIYRIKELKFVLLPNDLIDESIRDIWVQRKRMKIGSILKGIYPNARIVKRLCGYVVLEHELESLIEDAEGTTHYGFNLRKTGIKQIRETVKEELNKFERQLGLVSSNADAETRRMMLDSMKDLNELAAELGLITQQNMGIDLSDVDILCKSIKLPEEGSLRIELGDNIGPVEYEVTNKTTREFVGLFTVILKQPNLDLVEIYKQQITLNPSDSQTIVVPEINISRDHFESGKPLYIEAKYSLLAPPKVLSKCIRVIYVGLNPPEIEQSPVSLSLSCQFPRRDTRRIEVTEVIRKIKVKMTNVTPYTLVVDLLTTVRHLENPKTGRLTSPLFDLLQQTDFNLKPQQDIVILIDDVSVTQDRFGGVLETPADVTERCCDIYSLVRLAQASTELNKPRKWKLNKVSVKFYLEVDPPGHSIFQKVAEVDATSEAWQSKVEGDVESGYTFLLNIGHGAYHFVAGRDDKTVKTRYVQEQMLRQAYLIAFKNDIYKGPAEEYKETLLDSSLPSEERIRTFEMIMGAALNQL